MISFVMSVHLHGLTHLPLDIFSWNLTFLCFLKTCGSSISLIPDRNNRYFTWRCMYMIISHWIILRMEMLRIKVVEKIKTFYIKYPPPPENWAICEIMQKNVELDGQQMIWCMCFACFTTKATNAHSGYLLLFQGNSGYTNAPQCLSCYFMQLVASVSTCHVQPCGWQVEGHYPDSNQVLTKHDPLWLWQPMWLYVYYWVSKQAK